MARQMSVDEFAVEKYVTSWQHGITFSIPQGNDGQATAVDLRPDVYHPHCRHLGLFRVYRLYPHAAHRDVAGPVQHPDAGLAQIELPPWALPCQSR